MSDTETMTGGDGSATLAALSDTERATWQMTGELPTPAAPVTDPDDDEPEPSPATEKPAAVASPDKPISKRQQHINELARGKAEAEQRAAAAERERDELRASRQAPPRETAEPAKAKPASPKPAFPKFEEWAKANPDAIDEAEPDAAWYAYQQAWNDWDYDRRRTSERAAEAREAESRTLSQHEAKFVSDRETLIAEFPDFDAAIAAVPSGSVSAVMSRAALEAGARVTYWLATHPKERAELAQDTLYVDPNGPAFKGAVGLMRRHLLSVLAPRETSTDSPTTTSTSASAGPAAKTVTTAPVPPVTLSARSGDPADPLDAALKDRDFRRYEAEANARDLAGSKR